MSRIIKNWIEYGHRRPVIFNTTNCLGVSLIGELGSQTFEQKYLKKKKTLDQKTNSKDLRIDSAQNKSSDVYYGDYNLTRFAKMSVYRIILDHPKNYLWYTKILPFLVPTSTLSSNKTIIKKIVFEQYLYSTWCIVYFNFAMGKLEGKSNALAHEQVKDNFSKMYLLDCMIWPTACYLNFRYVPIMIQPSVVYMGSMVWTAVLSC